MININNVEKLSSKIPELKIIHYTKYTSRKSDKSIEDLIYKLWFFTIL
tara:strand:- start:942 stop:1085 length:144 start_codon:yes stop_codon:yes gene_type:complete